MRGRRYACYSLFVPDAGSRGHCPGGMTTKTMAKMQGKALWYVGPGRAELHEEAVAAPQPGEVQVRALFGAISRGTERLVHAGRVPESEYRRMRAPFMGGTFPFP